MYYAVLEDSSFDVFLDCTILIIPETLTFELYHETFFEGELTIWASGVDGVYPNDVYTLVRQDETSGVVGSNLIPRSIQVAPNPFRTSVDFALPYQGNLMIFDIMGRHVAQVNSHDTRAKWRGTDFEGRQLPSGVYFIRLDEMVQRVVRLR